MLENKKSKKKQPNRFLALTMIASQMGVTIFLGSYLGKHLDQRLQNPKPWFTISFSLLALIISMYAVLKQLKKLNDDN